MAISDKLKSLVAQMPAPDDRGMLTRDGDREIDKDKIEKAVAEIALGGRANFEGLVEMLGTPGSEENVKPHYALRCVGNHTLVAGDERLRKEFCEVLAARLSGNLSTDNKAFLCQELQWAGHGEAVAALGGLLLDEDLTAPAAMALVAIRQGATDQLLRALPEAQGKCRLSIVDALAALADTKATDALKAALQDPDGEVRLAGCAGLAAIADPGSVDLLLKAADVKPGWERIKATKECLLMAEKLAAAGHKSEAGRIYDHLRSTRTDPSETYIREAAQKALATV